MLTLIDAVCLAGNVRCQNDDAFGLTFRRAFVIDGASDLDAPSVSGFGSDASWLTRLGSSILMAADGNGDTRDVVRDVAREAAAEWDRLTGDEQFPAWRHPSATLLILTELGDGIEFLRLGDCTALMADWRGMRALRSDGKTGEVESARRSGAVAGDTLDLRSGPRRELLRRRRTESVTASHVLGLRQECAAAADVHLMALEPPAHVLLMTDGFSALVDVYRLYSDASILDAARDRGLSALAEELRAYERADSRGNSHPRWKTSDDATALLIRID